MSSGVLRGYVVCSVTAIMLLVGCSESPGPGPVGWQGADMPVVGQVGGSEPSRVEAPNGVMLDVPANALATPVQVETQKRSSAEVAPAPAGVMLVGNAIAFLPHGLTFDKPVTIALPVVSAADKVLRLEDESDTSWEDVQGAVFSDGKVTFKTSTFSIYAVAQKSTGGPAARGVVNPPEATGTNVPTWVVAERTKALLYWIRPATTSLPYRLVRAQLADEYASEVVYESADELAVVGVGPDAVYLHRPGAATIMRMSHDQAAFDEDWAQLGSSEASLTPGAVSFKHLYFASSEGAPLRVELTGGPVTPSPFGLGERCALSPDLRRAACANEVLDLTTDAMAEPRDAGGERVPNGFASADAEAFYFTPGLFGGSLMRVAFGASEATRLGTSTEVLSVAAAGGRLYLGRADGITTLDAETGAVLNTYRDPDPNFQPNAPMYIVGSYLYCSIYGDDYRRVLLSEIDGSQ